jgi:PPOX class probable F420-dependent enzyme
VDELTVELRSFLDQRRCGVLATHNSGCTIHLTPIWFLFEGGCFYFESSSTSRKVKNVEQSPSASVVVDAREPGRERWVSASGPVEILRDAESASINSRIRRRYVAEPALGGPLEAALAAADDVTLKLVPTAWRSWTAPVMESPEQLFLTVDP